MPKLSWKPESDYFLENFQGNIVYGCLWRYSHVAVCQTPAPMVTNLQDSLNGWYPSSMDYLQIINAFRSPPLTDNPMVSSGILMVIIPRYSPSINSYAPSWPRQRPYSLQIGFFGFGAGLRRRGYFAVSVAGCRVGKPVSAMSWLIALRYAQ